MCIRKEQVMKNRMIIIFFSVLFTLGCTYQLGLSQTSTVKFDKGVNKKVVKGWTDSLFKVSDVDSTTYIKKKVGGKDSLHRRGHRDVIVWIPDTTDLSKEFTMVLWFHGHYGYVPHRTFQDRTLKQFVPLVDTKNFVVVIPEMPWSVHTKTPTKRNSRLWMKPGDFLSFVKQVDGILLEHMTGTAKENSGVTTTTERLGKIDYRIVGHSAGGSTIKRLGITGDLCKLKPSMVVWSDSSYGPWLKLAWDGCLKNHRDIAVKVFVAKGDSPWLRATQFMGEFQGPPENLELHVMKKPKWSHKLIGNNIVKLSNLLGEK